MKSEYTSTLIAEFEHLGEVKLEIGAELFEDEKEKIIDMISEMFNDIIVSSEVVTVQNTEEGKTDKEKQCSADLIR